MLLRRYNLNYVPILRELLRTQSVAKTAEAVGLGQSTVSGTLARLREMFDDELLVMVGRRLELTEKGAQLLAQTERACFELESLVRPSQFDPRRETRTFVVATADYVAFVLAPKVERLLAEEAPDASVHFMDLPPNIDRALDRGAVDVAIFASDVARSGGVKSTSCAFLTDDMVVIASRERRGFSGPLTLEIYEASAHAGYQGSPERGVTHEHLALGREGIAQRDRLLVQQFLLLPYIVEESAALAVVQRRLAERFARTHAIDIFDPPFDVPALDLKAFWGKSAERDPAQRWLRDLLIRARPEDACSPRPRPVGQTRQRQSSGV